MLVLSRKENEKIFIGDSSVTVIEVRGGKVKLGIESPKGTKILRGELVGTEPKGKRKAKMAA